MSKLFRNMVKRISIRKYLCFEKVLFFGIMMIVMILVCIRDHPVNISENGIIFDKSTYSTSICNAGSKIVIHYAVNDILDCMSSTSKGELVNENFTERLPDFVKSYSNQKKSFDQEPLTVIVVPQSHNDPSYKKTYSEYFKDSTGPIFSLVVKKLFQYKDATFVWPEACFIERWWSSQDISMKNKLRNVTQSGRLEISSGQWVTPDEATPHYFAYLDQMIEGHIWVKEHLGVTPVSSFDMDQFGYASSTRYLMKEAGIKYSVLKRVHLGMKEYLTKMKLMNFDMKTPADKYRQGLFTQVEPYEWLTFPDSCGPSRAVCRDMHLGRPQITIPDPSTPGANRKFKFKGYNTISSFADKIVQQFKLKSNGYLHNVLLLPHGGDFIYREEVEWDKMYSNTKNLMKYINSNKKYNVEMRFGTVTDYFTEIEKRSEINHFKYPVVNGDFFPFTGTGKTSYWSGYYTTRPFLKRLGRDFQENVRAADILAALVILNGHTKGVTTESQKIIFEQLVRIRKELGLFQHHDTITGTSSVSVVKYYLIKYSSALAISQQIMTSFIEMILFGNCSNGYIENFKASRDKDIDKVAHESITKESWRTVFPASSRNSTRIDIVMYSETDSYLILYNSYTQARDEIIEFLYPTQDIQIINQISGENYNFDYILTGEKARILYNTRLPPLSLSSFKISKLRNNLYGKNIEITKFDSQTYDSNYIICENSQVNITVSRSDGSPQVMCYKDEHFCETLKIGWRHYIQNGGAYTLSADNQNEDLLKSDFKIRKLSGDKQCIVEVSHKLIKIEYVLQNTIGVNGRYLQLNIQTDLSRDNVKYFRGEVSMRVVTTIKNGDTFYTDSNGLHILKRKFRKAMPFSSNVYPVSSMVAIQDGSRVLNIHTIQAHGVVSWEPGTVDLFIDRVATNLEHGLKEAVQDNRITHTKLFLHFDACTYKSDKRAEIFKPSFESLLTNDLVQHPLISFFSIRRVPRDKTSIEFLQRSLPCDMILANMKCLTDDNFDLNGISMTLFRRLATHCNTKLTKCSIPSECESLSPEELFIKSPSKKFKVKEMSLTHLKWKKTLAPSEEISFGEMDIKTFLFVKENLTLNREV